MNAYYLVKKSQMHLFKNTPLYCQAKDNSFVLYKKKDEFLEDLRVEEEKHPDLFVHKKDRDEAIKELFESLNSLLERQCLSNDLKRIRSTLYLIVEEALFHQGEEGLKYLPETVTILFDRYSKEKEFLEVLTEIKNSSNIIIEHTINVVLLTFRYSFYHNLPEEKTKYLALCALLHDVGTSKIKKDLIEADHKLTDEEFQSYSSHTTLGHALIRNETGLDPSIARVAMDHHERIDGSGYPKGEKNISEEAQLIGLIDCYEPLTYRDKTFRRSREPFDSLNLIKEEVLQGKFSVTLFKKLCSCLSG